jgi:hypothetical protein
VPGILVLVARVAQAGDEPECSVRFHFGESYFLSVAASAFFSLMTSGAVAAAVVDRKQLQVQQR